MKDCIDRINQRLKKKNQILFLPEDPCLAELKNQLEQLDRRQVILWAFRLAEPLIAELRQKYPLDNRAQEALRLGKLWAKGEITMTPARRAILDIHAMAKEIASLEDKALAHAIGQGIACVHTPSHAMGLPIYHLTALIRRHGIDQSDQFISQTITYYIDVLKDVKQLDIEQVEWASFLRPKCHNKGYE